MTVLQVLLTVVVVLAAFVGAMILMMRMVVTTVGSLAQVISSSFVAAVSPGEIPQPETNPAESLLLPPWEMWETSPSESPESGDVA